MRRQIPGFRFRPRISLALTVSDADEVWIKRSVDSVRRQIYPHLELCICDNHSKRPHVGEVIVDYAAADGRIKVRRLPRKESWAGANNAAISMATGEFVALLDQGDEIAPEAVFKVVELIQSVRADVIYTDEDHIDVGGRRSDPVFKPYWSHDLLLSTAYIGRLCVMRRSVLEATGGFKEGFEGAEEHDLTLRLSKKTDHIRHLPEVLYHRRRLPGEPDSGEDRSRASSRAIGDALVRQGTDAAVEPGLMEDTFRVVRRVGGSPKVSVIVLAPEGTTSAPIVDELEQKTSYPIHQMIVAGVEGALHPSVAHVSHSLPAPALNLAADKAEGEYLVFMDARTRVTTPEWLLEMLSQAQRQEVGAVVCKLLNPSGGLRHGGSLAGINRLTGHPEESHSVGGHYLPLVDYTFNFLAASAECMMVRRTSFEKIQGFDDANLPSAFYDLDLSLRLLELGLLNVYTPYARVVCEGATPVPSTEEIEYMWTRWWEKLVLLLYYRWSPLHPAHHGLEREALSMISS